MEHQSKKTMRHFYCRDVLWETFEQMANDLDCSIDSLLNEAMRAYARSKSYAVAANTSSPSLPDAAPPAPRVAPPTSAARATNPWSTGMAHRPPPPPSPATTPLASTPAPPGPPPPPPPPSRMAPPQRPTPAPLAGPTPTLFLLFNDQRIPIDKDQFIIGRGTRTSDLPIKDGNISRKHAAIIRRNGTFYIKDLGSTNGIDYNGMRIDNKRIDEGDVFHLCDYELRFTYAPPSA